MVLVETQVTKGSLPAIYKPAAIRVVLLLFLATFIPTPWLAVSLPRASSTQLGPNFVDFAAGIPLGLLALSIAWRLFARTMPAALRGRGGYATLHLSFLILLVPAIAMASLWLPLIYWSLLGGYFLGAGAGFFALLLLWVQRLPEH